MRPELDIYERIELYLEGKLSGQELHDFQNQLQSDVALKAKFELVKLTNELVLNQQLLALKARMKTEMKGIAFEPTIPPVNTNATFTKFAAALVLLGAIGLGIYFWSITNTISTTSSSNTSKREKDSPVVKAQTIVPNAMIENAATPLATNSTPAEISNNNQTPITSFDYNKIALNNTVPTTEVKTQTPIETKEEIPLLKTPGNSNPCEGVILESTIKTSASCAEYASGEISFNGTNKGKAPYQYSINSGETFKENHLFTHLQAGNYTPSVKDAHGCKTGFPEIHIASKVCTKAVTEFAFNPQYHETFKFPIEAGQDGHIQITTRTGQLIFQVNLAEKTAWDGTQNNGAAATPGVYIYLITLTDGSIKKGYVTIYE